MVDNYKISKLLSINDTGENKSHQAGILIPKNTEILEFFPHLDKTVKNPRVSIKFFDDQMIGWSFNYIYYNNKFFKGTRNEFRLTGMTKFIKMYHLRAGDEIFFSKNDHGQYFISYKNMKSISKQKDDKSIVITLTGKWKLIKL